MKELHSYNEEMNELLLNMLEIGIDIEKQKENDDQDQETIEKNSAIMSIQISKSNRYADLVNLKKENLEKQIKLLELQQVQSSNLRDLYKYYQETLNENQVFKREKDEYLSQKCEEIPNNLYESRNEIKIAILGENDEDDNDEKNPSEFMKLEDEEYEKLLKKIAQKNQTPSQKFFNLFKLKH